MKEFEYQVCTQCVTFNHSNYIEETLKGFLIQKNNFPVVYVIIDDASTDGAQEFLRGWSTNHLAQKEGEALWKKQDYGDFAVAHLKNDPYKTFVIILLNENHYGRKSKLPYFEKWNEVSKYIAFCEGDDYWTDERKLQKQVDFLESHTEYAAYTTNAIIIDEKGQEKGLFSQKHSRLINNMNEIVIKRQFHLASILMRNVFVNDEKLKYAWDTYVCCMILTKGGIWYDSTPTCIYRKAGQGVTSTTARLQWIEINEKWSNRFFEWFSPKYLSYTGAYLSLTRDLLSSLVQGDLSEEEQRLVKHKYKKYSNAKINLLNIPFVLRAYRNKIIRMIKR